MMITENFYCGCKIEYAGRLNRSREVGKQIKGFLLLFALVVGVVGLFGSYGYAEDFNNITLLSIDDEDGFIRSNEDSSEDNHIRIGSGEDPDRTFVNILSFDTSSLSGITINSAKLVLTLNPDNPIWGGDGQPGPGDPGWNNPDDDGPWMDMAEAFNGNTAFEIPDDRDADADISNCAASSTWGFDTLTGPGDRIYIDLTPQACAFISSHNTVQIRIGTSSPAGSGDAADWSAMDFYDGGNGADSPILWINPSGELYPWPDLVEVVADDPDNDYGGLNNGDTLTLVFDMNTNAPPASTKAEIDDLIDFGGKSLGANYTGAWNTDANVLVITVVDATGGNLDIGDTIAIKADGNNDLKNQDGTSNPSTASAEVSGAWGPLPPAISAAIASDPDNDDPALNDGDMLTLVFDMNTNAPPASTKAEIDDLIDFGGKSLGTNYTGAWNTDANVLEITIVNAAGGNLDIGDTIAIKADGNNDLKNQAETSLASTSSAEVSGYWGPSIRHLYLGLNDANGQGPALAYVTFDPSASPGSRFNLVCYETTDTTISNIEVDSRAGRGGGIYVTINDGTEPTGEPNNGDKFLQEYTFIPELQDIWLLRESWNDITDVALSPNFGGVYGFERTVGGVVRFEPNNLSFDHAGQTDGPDVNAVGEVAIGVDGWIHCIFYDSGDNRLEGYIYDEENQEFHAQGSKNQPYVVDELVMSPLDNTLIWDNKEEKGGTIEQNAYAYHFIDGYETVCETPHDNEEDLMPGITDLAALSDGTIIAVDVNSYIDASVSLTAWTPNPHTIGPGDGQMSRAALAIVGPVNDVNAQYHLAVDEEDIVYVYGEGVLQAWRINRDEETFDLIESVAIGAGTEIAASVYRTPPLPPAGVIYDVYDDFDIEGMPDNWTYMDPCEVLLVNDESVVDPCMCDSAAWSYDGDIQYPGPWDYDYDYPLLPWLNRSGCYGGVVGEVLTFGPLLIRWTAPEAANDVEITGHLWQVNNNEHNSQDHQIAYKIYYNENELASGAVLREGGVTLEDRDNTVYFDDGGGDLKIIVPHVDVNDTISLLIDGSGPEGNGLPYYGYASFRITLPRCYFGLAGDLNRDCSVDLLDLGIMATNWLTDGEPDYFHDSIVNFNDYGKLAERWYIDCAEQPGNVACVPLIASIDSQDGFVRDDGYYETGSIRIGDSGEGNYYHSIVSFDTRILKDVPITRAWIRLTVKDVNIWGENPNPDPDKLNLTIDLCSPAFNYDATLTPEDFNAPADINDCALEDVWGLTGATVDQQILIELSPEAIAGINTSGITQFRINTGYSDDVEPYGRDQADAIDFYDGGEGYDKSPMLIIE